MTNIDGLPLPAAEHAIEAAHPGFRLYHNGPRSGEYATVLPEGTWADMGLPLYAPSVETIEQVIGEWEHATRDTRPARVTWQDDSLPHQIRLRFTQDDDRRRSDLIGVFCSCGPRVLAKRVRWADPDEPLRIWHEHMAEVTA